MSITREKGKWDNEPDMVDNEPDNAGSDNFCDDLL
jgi:hypothetical protein